MQIIRNLGQNRSYNDELNFLAKTGKIYIMDNHLAAFYCWCKEVDLSKDYALLHIDRHHDLGDALVKNSYYHILNCNHDLPHRHWYISITIFNPFINHSCHFIQKPCLRHRLPSFNFGKPSKIPGQINLKTLFKNIHQI